MRVGILTFHDTSNYGAMMQAYAVRQACANLGHETQVIDYRQRSTLQFYVKQALLEPPRVAQFRKWSSCRSFGRRRLSLTRPVRRRDQLWALASGFDCLCVGSDQIWDATGHRGFNPEFFFDFADPDRTRLISYAPSCGSMKPDRCPEPKLAGQLLGRFSNLSARDTNTQLCIRAWAGRDSELVLDPTFLVDYDGFRDANTPKGEYVLVYASRGGAMKAGIPASVGGFGLPVINAGFQAVPGAENRIGISPEAWVDLFRHASCVITTFFHGAIFSTLFRKPFVALSDPGKSLKVGDLLGRLGLSDQLYSGGTAEDLVQAVRSTDYTEAEPRIAAETERSRAYLAQALS